MMRGNHINVLKLDGLPFVVNLTDLDLLSASIVWILVRSGNWGLNLLTKVWRTIHIRFNRVEIIIFFRDGFTDVHVLNLFILNQF